MAVSSPSSPSTSLFSSPMISTSQTSTAFCSPSMKKHARFMPFTSSYDDDDSDDDMENIDPRVGPTTPSKRMGSNLQLTTPSPSKFIVRGTVTPSRAAPLFARFTATRRSSTRPSPEDHSDYERSSSGNDEDEEEGGDCVDADIEEEEGRSQRHASFVDLKSIRSGGDLPLMPIPVFGGFRHRASTQDTASYLLSVRSNSLHHMHYACSTHSNFAGSAGRGVLGVSRMLGAGASSPSVSHYPFHNTFRTSSKPDEDLFFVSSIRGNDEVAHPLCAEYAKSSRSLNNYKAQWLAVGDNEGRVHLLNTLSDPMAGINIEVHDKPKWEACNGSIFELKWRFDDEVIATGGSDFLVRLWSPETGEKLRTFTGHRGSPRTIAWDPNGSGNLLVSGGRDGAVHLYDVRVKDRTLNGDPWSPCLSLWEAHTTEDLPRPIRGVGSRGGFRSKTSLKQVKAVTSITYLPGRGSHLLASAGCADGKIKLWDFRYLANENATSGTKNFGGAHRKKGRTEDISFVDPLDQGIDLTKQLVPRLQSSKSSHGISSIIAGADKLFAACTDGRIYTVNCADFLQTNTTQLGHPTPSLYHPAQRSNTVYARMALHDDDRTLALGCNSGAITVWDTHAASLSLGQIYAEDAHYTGEVNYDDSHPLAQMARPAVLQNVHSNNFEINCISWAHGPRGPTLASVSDDYTIRTWHTSPRRHIPSASS